MKMKFEEPVYRLKDVGVSRMKPVTIPQDFWDSLGPERQVEVVRFEQLFGSVWATGSRVICPSSVHANSDWDVYAFAEKSIAKRTAWDDGYQQPAKKTASMADRSVSLKKNGLNITLFHLEYELRKFHEATEFCISLGGPETREKRIEVFRKFMGLRDRQDDELREAKIEKAMKLRGFPSKAARLEDRVQATLKYIDMHKIDPKTKFDPHTSYAMPNIVRKDGTEIDSNFPF